MILKAGLCFYLQQVMISVFYLFIPHTYNMEVYFSLHRPTELSCIAHILYDKLVIQPTLPSIFQIQLKPETRIHFVFALLVLLASFTKRHSLLSLIGRLIVLLINPLFNNGFFLLVWYNKFGIVQCAYVGVLGYNLKKNVFFCLKIFFTFTNSVDPDEMQHYAVFHLGLHCLQKILV